MRRIRQCFVCGPQQRTPGAAGYDYCISGNESTRILNPSNAVAFDFQGRHCRSRLHAHTEPLIRSGQGADQSPIFHLRVERKL